MTAAPMTVPAGQAVAYTITVTNNADTDTATFKPTDDDLPAANVSLTTAVPAHTVFQSLTVPAGWSCIAPARRRQRAGAVHDRVAARGRHRDVHAHRRAGRLLGRQRLGDRGVGERDVDDRRSQPGAEQRVVGDHPGLERAARDHRRTARST